LRIVIYLRGIVIVQEACFQRFFIVFVGGVVYMVNQFLALLGVLLFLWG
jgi:hypothetical protein